MPAPEMREWGAGMDHRSYGGTGRRVPVPLVEEESEGEVQKMGERERLYEEDEDEDEGMWAGAAAGGSGLSEMDRRVLRGAASPTPSSRMPPLQQSKLASTPSVVVSGAASEEHAAQFVENPFVSHEEREAAKEEGEKSLLVLGEAPSFPKSRRAGVPSPFFGGNQ